MPVPQLETVQPGTATTVVSTGTDVSARDGIEGRSVRADPSVVKPTTRDGLVKRLILPAARTTLPSSMPSTIANAAPVRTPIISFAIFAAYTRS